MAYEFKKLTEVESLTEVPENATVLAEVDGAVKRIPSSGLGGGSAEPDLTIKCSDDNMGITNALSSVTIEGSVSAVLSKLKSGERPNVRMVVNYSYNMLMFSAEVEVLTATFTHANSSSGNTEFLHVMGQIIMNATATGTSRYLIEFVINDTGSIVAKKVNDA